MRAVETEWSGVPSLSLSEGGREAIVSLAFGPRILFFGPEGGENLLGIPEDLTEPKDPALWRLYGGHRLWHAPESRPRSYHPDNGPVSWTREEEGVFFSVPTDPAGIEKEITLRWSQGRLLLDHRITNRNLWPIEAAPWAITVMAPGGTAILPLPDAKKPQENLLPDLSVSLWGYTDPGDVRIRWKRPLLRVHHDPSALSPLKIGLSPTLGALGYARASSLFLKSFPLFPSLPYPDRGAALECYTDAKVLEIESLAPLSLLAPGESALHGEAWTFTPLTGQETEESLEDLLKRAAAGEILP